MRWVDPDGLDILVIENGPTEGNPIGHSAAAVTGAGVFSSGNETPPGSSVYEYLARQASRRDTVVYIIKTTPEQDAAALEYLRRHTNESPGRFTDNCTSRTNNALDAAGIPQTIQPDNYPGSAGDRAAASGAESFEIPMGTNFPGGYPSAVTQFEPAR